MTRTYSIEPQYTDPEYWASPAMDLTVFERTGAFNTGLLDVRGNPIMATESIGPIGFNRL